MELQKNNEYRKKTMKAAKVEDLFFYVEEMKKNGVETKEALDEIQRFIKFQMGYTPKVVARD